VPPLLCQLLRSAGALVALRPCRTVAVPVDSSFRRRGTVPPAGAVALFPATALSAAVDVAVAAGVDVAALCAADRAALASGSDPRDGAGAAIGADARCRCAALVVLDVCGLRPVVAALHGAGAPVPVDVGALSRLSVGSGAGLYA
jgi:hypothetical protein